MKKAMLHSFPKSKELRYSEMVTLLSRITTSINSRPLALGSVSDTSLQEDCLVPLTPNQLLLGHNTKEKPSMEYSEDNRLSARLAYIQSIHTEWWKRWIVEVCPTLVPCRKWRSKSRNLQKGDIVMMVYKGNLVNDYRLAKVINVYPDERNIVRSVDIAYRRRDKREKPEVYKSKPPIIENIGVQRLSLLQAAGEDLPTGIE